MSRVTGPFLVVAADRAHTFARTSAMATSNAPQVPSVISWKVRNTVEPEDTQPNRSGWTRRCSMSAQLSPPPASTSAIWTRTSPRSCNGMRSPVHGIRDDSESPRPRRSAEDPRACRPTWATTPAPPGSTVTRAVLLPFTSDVSFWSRDSGFEHQQFPLLEGLFRGRGVVSSRGGVNDRG
jgi:hypothetical protein